MYLKKMYYVGDTIEVHKTISWRYGKKIPRQKGRINPTPERMKDVNERNAIANLRRLINHNFQKGDFHLVCKYPDGTHPTVEETKEHGRQFLRWMRKLYRELGMELKYIHTIEYTKTRAHHHFIINEAPLGMIRELWAWGMINVVPLYSEQFDDLAAYLVKDTKITFQREDSPSRRRWDSSRNLKRPRLDVEVVDAKAWREEPQPIKGYIIDTDSVKNGVNEAGWPYQSYRMIRIQPHHQRERRQPPCRRRSPGAISPTRPPTA